VLLGTLQKEKETKIGGRRGGGLGELNFREVKRKKEEEGEHEHTNHEKKGKSEKRGGREDPKKRGVKESSTRGGVTEGWGEGK